MDLPRTFTTVLGQRPESIPDPGTSNKTRVLGLSHTSLLALYTLVSINLMVMQKVAPSTFFLMSIYTTFTFLHVYKELNSQIHHELIFYLLRLKNLVDWDFPSMLFYFVGSKVFSCSLVDIGGAT